MRTRHFVNLHVNPCKMCMPMGAATAFKGIEACIVLMHGSQGCSTYIRRHMATHYNEPIDIASSSLNEKGTVYGGASNLKKAIQNVIRLYRPKAIGICTTCLAETIGEDIERITREFLVEEGLGDTHCIPVSTPGYGGSQYEGYLLTARKVVEYFAKPTQSHEGINVIVSSMTPADIRELKEILESFGLSYTLFPDISDTLDAPFQQVYTALPEGGTKIEQLEKMGGARATIEIGELVQEEFSPGRYLEDNFQIPLYKCPLPIGLGACDALMEVLGKLAEREIPVKLQKQRGRLLDAMVDSHKYNGEGRAAIFGEPETICAVTRLCLENGVLPAVVATGTQYEDLKEQVCRNGLNEQESSVLEDSDFDTIRSVAMEKKVNILIGNSDGKYITEKEGIPLVRIGFPVHDHIGAQRKVFIGYEGTMGFLDEITNTLLDQKHTGYRARMYDAHYPEEEKEIEGCSQCQ